MDPCFNSLKPHVRHHDVEKRERNGNSIHSMISLFSIVFVQGSFGQEHSRDFHYNAFLKKYINFAHKWFIYDCGF